MTDDFPQDLKAFLAENVRSVAQLEALLLLRRERERAWTAAEVSRALYTTEEMCTSQLSELEARGLLHGNVESAKVYRYQPQSAELEELVNRLATLYAERRVSLITAIYSEPGGKIRTFAEAFRFFKEK